MRRPRMSATEAERLLDRAQDLLKAWGPNWKRIAREIGVTEDWVRRRLDPGYREMRNTQVNMWRRQNRLSPNSGAAAGRRRGLEADIRARLAEIPPDTRDLTGRFFGDPLPQRSALARKQAEGGQ